MTASIPLVGVIPPPEYVAPTCPLCYTEASHDGDGLICDNCRIGWNDGHYDKPGYRLDDHLPQCTEQSAPWPGDPEIGHIRFRCVRNAGHDQPHAGGRIDQPDPTGTHGAHVWETRALKVVQ